MAERRMLSKAIVDSDAFLDMPLSTQCLYFHLNMRADDDGFVNNPKRIQKLIGASDDDLKLLIAKSFILVFESGVIVIKHWRINNYIRNDRYHRTNYQDELAMLEIKDNRSYSFKSSGSQLVSQRDTENRLDKIRLDKNSVGKINYNNSTPTKEDIQSYIEQKGYYSIDVDQLYEYCEKNEWKTKNGKIITDWKGYVDKWYSNQHPTDEKIKERLSLYEETII